MPTGGSAGPARDASPSGWTRCRRAEPPARFGPWAPRSPSTTSPTPTRAATCCSPDVSFRRRAGPPRRARRRQRRRQEHAAADRSPASCRADEGEVALGGRVALHGPGRRRRATGTVRELLLAVAPARVRDAGRRDAGRRARRSPAGDDERGHAARRGDRRRGRTLGGYELEGQWDAACRRIVARRPRRGRRPRRRSRCRAASASGSCSTLLFASDADVLLLDEPDNFLDVPAKRALEERDPRDAQDGPADLPRPRAAERGLRRDRHARGQRRLGPRRLLRHLPGGARAPPAADGRPRSRAGRRRSSACASSCGMFKERARYSPDWAKRADADGDALAALRRRRARRPRPSSTSRSRCACAAATPRAASSPCATSAIDGLVRPFSEEIHFGERVGLIGPNGSGKTHLMRAARRRDGRPRGRASCSATASRPASSPSSTPAPTSPAATCSTS